MRAGARGKTGCQRRDRALTQQLQSEVKDIEQGAVTGLASMNADDRQQVRTYYTGLWIWNRLEQKRWEKAKLALRQESRRRNFLEVDHIVAWDLWRSKLDAVRVQLQSGGVNPDQPDIDELAPKCNELGNCMLLEKNFNISKSNKPLAEFLEDAPEFKESELTIDEWASALDLEMAQVDCADTAVDALGDFFTTRSQKIRGDLEQFIRGTMPRIDLKGTST